MQYFYNVIDKFINLYNLKLKAKNIFLTHSFLSLLKDIDTYYKTLTYRDKEIVPLLSILINFQIPENYSRPNYIAMQSYIINSSQS